MKKNILIIVDHASNSIPTNFSNFTINQKILNSHIAYDLNIKNFSLVLSKKINSHLICGKYSRLIIDLNRSISDPTLISAISDKKIINGNLQIDNLDMKYRINNIYNKYHEHIYKTIKKYNINLLISLHSFNPIFKGKKRKIEVGILSNNYRQYSELLMKNLIKVKKYKIGDNEPYRGNLIGDTMYKHGFRNNIPHTLIEIRNDLIESEYKINTMMKFLKNGIFKTNLELIV